MNSRSPIFNQSRQKGFSLIELAMVLLIIGLLLAGLVPTISSLMEQKYRKETTDKLEEIQQALIGFAITNNRLPCPAAATSNGVESFASGGDKQNGNCSHFFNGFVPAATLGISSSTSSSNTGYVEDAWGNRIRYAVTKYRPDSNYVFTAEEEMSKRGINKLFDSSNTVHLLVCSIASGITNMDSSSASCASGKSLTSKPGVPVIIYSIGKNGAQGGGSTDELANLGDDRVFVSHSATNDFDDLMTWPSPGVLINRMVTANRL